MIGNSWIARVGIKFIKVVATVYSSLPIISAIYYFYNHKSLLVDLFPNTLSVTLMDTSISVYLHIWLAFEFIFLIYFVLYLLLFQTKLDPVIPSKHEREESLHNCLNTVDKFETWLEGWFIVGNKKAKFDQIHRGNFEEWLAWSFFSDHIENVRENPEYIDELRKTISDIEKIKKMKFHEGYNPDVKCIRLTLDPVRAIPRPFIFYVVIFLLNYVNHIVLVLAGFDYHGGKNILSGYWSSTLEFDFQEETSKSSKRSSPKIRYWYHKPGGNLKKNQQPIVFIHGIGGGLWFYANFVRKLYNLDRPLFMVELPHVSMRLVNEVPTMKETVLEIEEMLESKNYHKATFVGHSLGSAVCAWVIKEARKRVSGCVLIDPICFLLHLPDVAYNFVYRAPTAANEHATYLFASRELCISYYFSRHFHWFQSALYISSRDKLPTNTHIYLSEHDNIVPSSEVYKYLLKNNVSVHMMRGLDHSSYLFRSDWENRIVSDVLKCCRRGWSTCNTETKFFIKKNAHKVIV